MNRKERLTDTLVRKLKPASREYTLRDTLVPSFGVRVHPSGGRSFVHIEGGRRVSLGSVTFKAVKKARQESLERLASRTNNRNSVPKFSDFATGPWRDSWLHRCKPSTIRRRDQYLSARLLPAFGLQRLDRITPAMVHRWFDDYSRTAPGGANSCLQILSQVLNHAVLCSHITSNPARSVTLNPRKKLTRFLSREELDRLHGVLDRLESLAQISPVQRMQLDIIRLLMLTGCRKAEIIRLQKQEVYGASLRLLDSKTGPRTVFLNTEARTIIDRRMAGASAFIFPSSLNPGRPLCNDLRLWYSIRKAAGINDVRLHDLRHTFASYAVMEGTPLPVVARLLGHSQTTTTLRYAHTGDRETEAAAERVAGLISGLLETFASQ
ncbi:MAG: tyrosine-type recombinase/integrase [bacterium]|nr:tyrosine-type recombinase/integrase [bacterium]